MTPEKLRATVGKGRVAPVYFFTGSALQSKREAIGALVAQVPEGARAFNVQSFHAFESDLAEVLTAARTLPFFGGRRVVILRDVEKLRGAEGRQDQLGAYLASPDPETVLVVTTEDDDKAKTLVNRHGERWSVVAFRPPQGAALVGAVQAEAARLGCSIDGAAMAALMAAAGDDCARLFNELAKLRAAVGANGVVDVAAVERFAAGYAHHGLNDIVEAVGGRDLPASLRLLHEATVKEEEFLMLLGMLGKRLRVLWYLAAPALDVPRVFNVSWQLEKLRPQARRFSRTEIERGLQSLAPLDERVKRAHRHHELTCPSAMAWVTLDATAPERRATIKEDRPWEIVPSLWGLMCTRARSLSPSPEQIGCRPSRTV